MDINQILPLLLKGDNNDQKTKLLSAMLSGGGNKEDLLAQVMGANGGGPEMQAMMNLMKTNKKTAEKYEGLKIISFIAPPDILGTMFKILSSG